MKIVAAAAKSLQSCPTLCDPIDGSPPDSHSWDSPGKNMEWVAISFSSAWKWKVKVKSLSRVWLFETPWTVAYQAPPSMGFPRQEYWNGLPLPSPCLCVNWSFASWEFFSKYFQSVVGWFRGCETWGYGVPTVSNTVSGAMQFFKIISTI